MYRWRGLGDTAGVESLITATASRYGVPASLALAVARRESQFNQAARGTSGEIGVFQLMPGTASDLKVNPYDLAQNVDGGVRYLAQLRRQFGDWFRALEGYNGGPGNVTRGTVSGAAQTYAVEVLGAAGISGGSGSGDGWTWSDGDGGELPEGGGEGPGPEDGGGDPLAPVGLSTAAWVGLGLTGLAAVLVLVSD